MLVFFSDLKTRNSCLLEYKANIFDLAFLEKEQSKKSTEGRKS